MAKSIRYTVGALIEELRGYKPGQLVLAIGSEESGKWVRRPVYKTEQDADDTEVYLYLGDAIPEEEGAD
ncbi:unnamed protein product [marine sediment metagenome]|uniref:Uncharacterized protein n=1 Tax=marine sediment metagenome TaxID=412755 RepID=X0V6Q1_9ZZZZ